MTEPVIWKRRDLLGLESCRLHQVGDGWRLEGAAVFIHDARACRLDYLVDCDGDWIARAAVVTGWVGDRNVDVTVARDDEFIWTLNGQVAPEVEGCSDLDLNFSPATNTLPIRRLEPEVGAVVAVRAAWLRFPGFTLEPLEQTYTRMDLLRYRYESGGGNFVAELTVDDPGLVIEYGEIWSREA
jgi:hypothetical protein